MSVEGLGGMVGRKTFVCECWEEGAGVVAHVYVGKAFPRRSNS